MEFITWIVKLNFKKLMLRSHFCDYNNAYIHVSGTMTGEGNIDIQLVFKNCVPFTNGIS